jgi:hypothetical protein
MDNSDLENRCTDELRVPSEYADLPPHPCVRALAVRRSLLGNQ